MIVVYILTALVGALTTLVALSSHGWLLALLCAPVGGSALTLVVIAVDLLRYHARLAERAAQDGASSPQLARIASPPSEGAALFLASRLRAVMKPADPYNLSDPVHANLKRSSL
jgi:hypothetical protein